MKVHRSFGLTLGTLALLATAACGGGDKIDSNSGDSGSSGSTSTGALTVSGQDFTEMQVMAAMYDQLLAKSGYDVTTKLVSTRDIYIKQMSQGNVDVVPEYLAGITDFLNTAANGDTAKPVSSHDPNATLKALKPLAAKEHIAMLKPSQATDQNAFFVTKKYADQNSLKNLSDLGALGKPVVLAAAPDCEGRTDCAGGLSKDYGIKITKVLPLGYASPQTYDSVLKGEAQLGETSTTDASLTSQGLVLLQDDKGIQPVQNLIPAVSTEFLKKHADVKDVLDSLMAKLTTDDLTQLNGKVGNERQKPEDVAKQYLQDQGLLS
jgi:osmoprotectant transport system substrate-binding protein